MGLSYTSLRVTGAMVVFFRYLRFKTRRHMELSASFSCLLTDTLLLTRIPSHLPRGNVFFNTIRQASPMLRGTSYVFQGLLSFFDVHAGFITVSTFTCITTKHLKVLVRNLEIEIRIHSHIINAWLERPSKH